MSLSSLGFFKVLLIPWALKFLWAPLVDKYATKRTWLCASLAALGLTCILAIFIHPTRIIGLCVVVFCLNLFASTQDIAVDGIAIQILGPAELGAGNTVQVVGYKLGAIFGGGILVWLIEYIGWSGIFVMLATFYLVSLLAVSQIKELISVITESPSNRTRDKGIQSSAEQYSCSVERYSSSVEQFSTSAGQNSTSVEQYSNSDKRYSNSAEQYSNSVGQYPSIVEQDPSSVEQYSTIQLQDRTARSTNGTGNSFEIERTKEVTCSNCSKESSVCPCKNKETLNDLLATVSRFLPEYIVQLLYIPGTVWTISYVVLYKLGEQGAVGMFPLFLVDHGIPASEVTMWTGVIGQGSSIAGSLFGGWLLSSTWSMTPLQILPVFFGLRLLPMMAETIMIGLVSELDFIVSAVCIVSMCLLQLIGGAITTATFTLMMQCSQSAPVHIQATHYTGLATLEVMGKLSFMSIIGYFTDRVGYFSVFCFFIGISFLVFPLLHYRRASDHKTSRHERSTHKTL